MKKIIWAIALILVLVGIYTYTINSKSSTEQVKIGGLFGLTGPISFAGEVSRNGLIMALEDRKIDPSTVPIEDTQSKGVGAVTAVTKLINIDGVDVVIGPEWSEASNAISKIVDENQIVTISPWMTNEFEFIKSPYFFSATPSERGELRAMLDHMKAKGVSRLAIISHAGSAWSEDLLTVVKYELKNNYSSIALAYESIVSDDIADYRTELVKIKSNNSDVVLSLVSQKAHPEIFLKQFSDLSLKARVYMPKGTLGLISTADRKAGLANAVFSPVILPGKRAQEFSDKYKARFGVTPAAISGATTYDATMLVIDAVEKGARNANDVMKYLNSVKDYNGYSGVITFNELGMVTSGPTELREVRGESFVVAE